MPRQTFAMLIGAVILAAALTVLGLVWIGGGSIGPWAVLIVICVSGALKLLLNRK